MGYLNIVRHPGWEQPASGVRDPGRMSLSLVGLLDTIAPDFTQELRVSDDEIWLWPAAERAGIVGVLTDIDDTLTHEGAVVPDAYAALVEGYRTHVAWEPWRAMERRTAALLPGLLLARIDGKSPVEYLTGAGVRADVRAFARARR